MEVDVGVHVHQSIVRYEHEVIVPRYRFLLNVAEEDDGVSFLI